jgi:tRNA G37 N-methylase TrmD
VNAREAGFHRETRPLFAPSRLTRYRPATIRAIRAAIAAASAGRQIARLDLEADRRAARQEPPPPLPADAPVILLSPQGRRFNQGIAQELASHGRIALICGRYEGGDERARELVVTDELSIGDFVISGGELAAALVMDAVTRLLPGALGCQTGASDDSFATGLLEYPQYTRPPVFRGLAIPDILVSCHHARWRASVANRRCAAPGSAGPICWRRRR